MDALHVPHFLDRLVIKSLADLLVLNEHLHDLCQNPWLTLLGCAPLLSAPQDYVQLILGDPS